MGLGTLGRKALHALNRALPAAAGGLTVLGYHLVGGGTSAVVDLAPEVFRGHLDDLEQCGRVVSLSEGLDALESGEARDEHLIALTFDDGFGNFHERVWPLLRDRAVPATLYVQTGFLEGTSPSPIAGADTLRPLSWEQLREVAASELISIGSHTLTHPDLRRLSAAECRHELVESRRLLAEGSGQPVSSFCYPRALWSKDVKSLVAETYENAVVGGGRRNRGSDLDRHRIFRLPMRRDMPAELPTLLNKAVWLEEWVASRLRGVKQ